LIILLAPNAQDFPVIVFVYPLLEEHISPFLWRVLLNIYLKIICFMDDRKAVIVYAITIAEKDLNSR